MTRERVVDPEREALSLIGLAVRAGRAAVGATAVRAAARKGTLEAIVVARDAGGNALGRIPSLPGVPVAKVGLRTSLGRSVGRAVATVVGITDRQLGERIGRIAIVPNGGSPRLENDPEDPGRKDT